jgi:hypothetical protein
MKTSFCKSTLSIIALSPWIGAGLHASEAVDQAGWPQKVTVTVGDVRTRIDGPKMWTLSGIDFQDRVMASEDSAYGTVFTIRNVGHLGTAHFLDVPGKPGEIEKENVTSIKFFVDGKPVDDFSKLMELGGQSFRMERTSDMRGMQLESSVSLRDDVLIETVHIQATEPMDLQKAHALMYAWTPEAPVGIFGAGAEIKRRTTFLKEGATVAEAVKDMDWAAVFDPEAGKGSVFVVLQKPSNDDVQFLLVDSPGLYRKIALYSLIDQVVPVGWQGTYQSAVGFFSATQADWEQKALQRLAELRAYGAK